MFARLFAQAGLSLERLRALVEVGAYGSIVKATGAEPARQSLYSRQIKELEDFFQISLLERHGRGVRLTASGRELARISRFFLLGLSNFQRGCLAEGQAYRVGADATFSRCFLLPVLAEAPAKSGGARFSIETVIGDEVERRLHDLTLGFGVVTRRALSRPLQMKELGTWQLVLWVPKTLAKTTVQAQRVFAARRLPLVWPEIEIERQSVAVLREYEPALVCGDFLQARDAVERGQVAGFLPEFLAPKNATAGFLKVPVEGLEEYHPSLAWNPRVLRLNPHAARRRDLLIASLTDRLRKACAPPGQTWT